MKDYLFSHAPADGDKGNKQFYRMMKLTTGALMFCSCLAFAGNAHPQNSRVNIYRNQVQLKEILDDIERQTDYLFVSNRDIDLSMRVTIHAKDEPVSKVLHEVLGASGLTYVQEGVNIVLTEAKEGATSLRQTPGKRVVKGKVSDANGESVIGANVKEKGTANGVVTDLDGNFSLSVAPGAVLAISYIGYRPQEVRVDDRQEYIITLAEDVEALDEVVVIGYGTVKKSHLTGAVASVSSKDLQASVARTASSALQGRIAGVNVSSMTGQPGEGMNINIRGVSSLSSTTPLYVIDGVYGDINMVDPSDIQSIEVLKDASAAAIYGSRAANGVVLVTTKGGKLETPTRVVVDAYTGVQSVAHYIDLMDGDQLRDFARQTGLSTAEGLVNWNGGKGTDWQREVFKPAMITKVSLNVSGGNKTSTYNLSGSYLKQDGIMKTTGYEAWNVRTKNTFSLFDNHVRMGATAMLKFDKKMFDNEINLIDVFNAVPMWMPYDEQGNWGQAPNWTRGVNPVGQVEAFDNQKHGVSALLNAYAEVDLGLKGLVYKFNAGVNKSVSRNYTYSVPYHFSSTSQDPDYRLNEGTYWWNDWLIENTLTYANTFGAHDVSALVGYSAQSGSGRGFGAGRTGLLGGLNTINAGSTSSQTTYGNAGESSMLSMFGRLMYSFDSRYMLSASLRRDGSSKFAKGHRWGVFPSVSVGWNVMNERFFEPARSVVNELKVRASYGVLGNLNGIADYATQSVVSTGLNSVQGDALWEGAITGKSWVSPQEVSWEKTKTTDIGVDLSLLNNKWMITADYFIQKTEDMLLSMPQPLSFGLEGTPTVNAGTVENRGFEVAINHRNNVGEVYYHVGINASFLKNELTKVNGSRDEWIGFNNRGGITYAKTGHSIGYFYLIKSDGLFRSEEEVRAYVDKDGNMIQPSAQPGDVRYVDANHDGKIDNLDRQDCGSALPKMTLGLTLGAEWRGFDVNLFFDGNFGNKIYDSKSVDLVMNAGVGNQYAERMEAWTANNPDATLPRFITGSDNNGTNWAYTDRWLKNGSFVRLKTLELGYAFPKAWITKAHLQNLRLYTAMENLFTLTGYKNGSTPDLGDGGGDGNWSGSAGVMTRGIDNARYPSARTITFGLQVTL